MDGLNKRHGQNNQPRGSKMTIANHMGGKVPPSINLYDLRWKAHLMMLVERRSRTNVARPSIANGPHQTSARVRRSTPKPFCSSLISSPQDRSCPSLAVVPEIARMTAHQRIAGHGGLSRRYAPHKCGECTQEPAHTWPSTEGYSGVTLTSAADRHHPGTRATYGHWHSLQDSASSRLVLPPHPEP